MNLAAIPSPTQGVWQLGPLPIRAYALCIIAGIAIAYWTTERRWVARGGAPNVVMDISTWAVPFGIVGGRIYHVITSPRAYFGAGGHPWRAFAIWEGGLGIWGAIALGALGAWIACRRRGIPLPAFGDSLAPGLLLAEAVGRLGNWFNNELYGGPTDLPWALKIYEWSGGKAAVGPDGRPIVLGYFHPTFLYELLWCLAAAAVVAWADRRFRLGHGRAFALCVATYCTGRLWIELLRTDPAEHFFGVRLNVFTATVVGLCALVYFLSPRRPRESLAGRAGGWPAGGSAARPAGPGTADRTAAPAGGEEPTATERRQAPDGVGKAGPPAGP
jgi:prolipoprotein diacylglyceryl transferase